MLKNIIGASIATALLSICATAHSHDQNSDRVPKAHNGSYANVLGTKKGIDEEAVLLESKYLFIAGSAFTPRTSSQTVTYPGAGCTYSSDALTTSLELPDDAMINGVRLYYYSTDASSNVTAGVTRYNGAGTFTDLVFETSSGSTGYTDEYFGLSTPKLVDNYSESLALVASTDTGTRFCGMRVFYDTP